MLDGKCAFNTIVDKDVLIQWGAYLGTPDNDTGPDQGHNDAP